MKNTLAVSMRAATKIFLSIAASDITALEKGRMMCLASRMMENPALVTKNDFSSLPGGEEIFETIALAVRRSQRARAAAAARKKVDIVPVGNVEPIINQSTDARPRKHPRLNIKCRYKTNFSERTKRYGRKGYRPLNVPLIRASLPGSDQLR